VREREREREREGGRQFVGEQHDYAKLLLVQIQKA